MSNPDDRLMRYRVVEWLVRLASTFDEQATYFRDEDWPLLMLDHYLHEGVSWTALLNDRNALSPEIVSATDVLVGAVESLLRESDEAWERSGTSLLTPELVRDDPRWEAIRGFAGRLDIATWGYLHQGISDADYNVRRDDAP